MSPDAGGPPQGIRNLMPGLQQKAIEQFVLCLDEPQAPFLSKETLPVQPIGPAKTSWAFSKSLQPWLSENLAKYDAVICHGLWQYPLLAVQKEITKLRKRGKAPKFYIYPHGMLDPWFQKDPSRRMKALRNEIYWRLIERKNLNSADAVLYTCEEERRLAATTFPGYQATEEVVGYGIPSPPALHSGMTEAFQAIVPQLSKNQPYFLFLSRIHPKKGVDLLIKAYVQLARDYFTETSPENCQLNTEDPNIFPALVIAGPLDSDYAKEMQQLAKQLLPSFLKTENSQLKTPQIHFVGMLQSDAKWGAIYGAEAFVLPSHQENFGIAVVEALACGTPVLISDKVNIWREIVDAGGGWVANDDQAGAEELLKRWLNSSPESREQMGSAARAAYENCFAIEPAAKRLADFLNR